MTLFCTKSILVLLTHMYIYHIPKEYRSCSCKSFWSTFMVQLFARACCLCMPLHLSIRQCTSIPTRQKATKYHIVVKTVVCAFCTIMKASRLLVGLESCFWVQIGVELNSKSIGAHYRCGDRIRAAH